MKRVIAILLAVMMMLSMAACAPAAEKEKFVVGVCQIEPHPALDAATKGFKDALVAALGEDKVEFIEQNAAGDSNTLNSIITDFVSKKVDLILANATPVLQTAYNATQTIPILGTSVTEYGVALDIKDFNGTVGGNVSGTSDLAPLDKQAALFTELIPDKNTIGLIYCSAEANSKYQVDEVKKHLESAGKTCKVYTFTDSNDMAGVCTNAVSECDAIYVPTDNTAASCAETIYGKTGKTPIIAGEAGICAGCGIATLSISYYDLGYKTGEMAAQILTGEAKIAEMPIAYAPQETKKYNAAICEDLGIDVEALKAAGYVALD